MKQKLKEQFVEAGIAYTMSTRPNVICGDTFAEDDVIRQFNRNIHFETGAEYGYNFAIDKVCEFLKETLREGEDSHGCVCIMTNRVSIEATINALKKAMKGE